MAEDEAVAILDELRRVGADLERPPGLAVGTGFRADELLAWLRELPDGIGHDAFVARLTAHVEAATRVRGPGGVDDDPVRGTVDAASPGRTRWFPTHEQLALATELLLESWDPVGARLGAIPREEMAERAFTIVVALLERHPRPDREWAIAEFVGSIEEEVFGVRRSPLEHRRLLVRRLQSMIDDHPAPPLEYDPAENTDRTGPQRSAVVIVGPRADEPPIRDPRGTCTRCGAIGTIAAVSRVIEPKMMRFCASCWRAVRHEYMSFVTDASETPDQRITEYERMHRGIEWAGSRSWDDVVDFIRMVTSELTEVRTAERAAYLPQLAREIVEESGDMDGPMPPEIESFVRQHNPPVA